MVLLNEFDPVQVRYAGLLFRKITEIVVTGAEQTGNVIPAIQLLYTVILRLDPSSSTLTSTHFSYIHLCLATKMFSEGAAILDKHIYHIPQTVDKATAQRSYQYLCSDHESSAVYLTPSIGLTNRLEYRDYLEYYLYGGMIYMGLRDWEKALFFFEVVLVAPTANTASMIMVEAYKKWLLVGLLINGKAPPPPKAANPSAMKTIKAIAKPYECLVEGFKSKSLVRLQWEIREGQDFWRQDCNYGLVFEVLEAFRKFSVLQLGETFEAISVAEIARRTSPDPNDLSETISYISDLIARGGLSATLSCPNPFTQPQTLRFLPSPNSVKSEDQIHQDLSLQSLELQNLLEMLSENDHRLEISKEYIDTLRRMKKQRDQEGKDGKGNGAGGGATDFDMDEDIMM